MTNGEWCVWIFLTAYQASDRVSISYPPVPPLDARYFEVCTQVGKLFYVREAGFAPDAFRLYVQSFE